MGAKAPIWLDVRTVVAVPALETGRNHILPRCPNGCLRIEFQVHDLQVWANAQDIRANAQNSRAEAQDLGAQAQDLGAKAQSKQQI